jgi:hypothetical protein
MTTDARWHPKLAEIAPGPSKFEKLVDGLRRRRPPGTDPVPVGDDHPRPTPRPPAAAEAKLEFRDDEPDQTERR